MIKLIFLFLINSLNILKDIAGSIVVPDFEITFNETFESQEDFNYAMNMMYSDYSRVLAKLGISRPSVYVELADAFLDDVDAPSDKAVRYFKAMGD